MRDALISQIHFWSKTLYVSGSFSVHRQEFSLHTQQWYMSYRFSDSLRAGSGWTSWSCSQAVSKLQKQIWVISASNWFYYTTFPPLHNIISFTNILENIKVSWFYTETYWMQRSKIHIKCLSNSSLSYIFDIVRRKTTSRPLLQLDSGPIFSNGNSKFSKLAVIWRIGKKVPWKLPCQYNGNKCRTNPDSPLRSKYFLSYSRNLRIL